MRQKFFSVAGKAEATHWAGFLARQRQTRRRPDNPAAATPPAYAAVPCRLWHPASRPPGLASEFALAIRAANAPPHFATCVDDTAAPVLGLRTLHESHCATPSSRRSRTIVPVRDPDCARPDSAAIPAGRTVLRRSLLRPKTRLCPSVSTPTAPVPTMFIPSRSRSWTRMRL